MFDQKKYEIALVEKGLTKSFVAKSLGISREALRRREKNQAFSIQDVVILRRIFGKETADGFLFA